MKQPVSDSEVIKLVRRVADPLAALPGIAAIVLGGSLARGTADERSDIDLGLYYEPCRPFEVAELERLAEALDDRHARGLVTGFGEWGAGVNGGGWLSIDGFQVDLLYRDLGRVREAIAECSAGRPGNLYQLGHPLDFAAKSIWLKSIAAESFATPAASSAN
ncbi:MAG TPA: nucleotidyltransferase domain-containing protein [Candidatus Binataceae bacterium]|nr:nucleotidyltransferase domain-containing protein [Candidatus Binataceae bacterium]